MNPNDQGADGIDFQIRLTVAFSVSGVGLQVSTLAGETAAEVAANVAAAINADPSLSQASTFAFATGSTVITNSMITSRVIIDPGLRPIVVPGLHGWALALLAALLGATATMRIRSAARVGP